MAEMARNGCFLPCLRCGLAGLFLTALPVHAQTRIPLTFGDIEITLQTVPPGNSWHGYFEYVFLVHNKSAERPHTVDLSIPFEKSFAYGYSDFIRDLRRSVPVGANETVRVALWQPDHPPLNGRDVAVTIDGQKQERELALKPNETMSNRGYYWRGRPSSSTGMAEPLILLGSRVKPLPKREPPAPAPMMGGMPGGAGMPAGMPPPRPMPPKAIGGEIPMPPVKPGLPARGLQLVNAEAVESWSVHWLAYTRYDGIVVTADELKAMPAGVRAALWQYVETGGALFVIGPTDLRGLSAVAATTKVAAGWMHVRAGFGQCLVSPNDDYDKWDANHFEMLAKSWSDTIAPWQEGRRSTADANGEFPIIDDLGVPVRGLFVLMFLFVLGIGPINFMVLSRLKRRIWLLWTTPLISLCTCVAVFGYMLISEGWQGQLRTATLTLLDETTHRATTIGWTGVYSPLTLGDGLHFSYETEVIPQRYFDGRRGGTRSCTLDWSRDQHFAIGWVEARVPAQFKVRKSELRRERIALQREADGRYSMVNGLGADIRRFWFADDKGQIYAAADIAAGARIMLTQTEKESQVATRNVGSILSAPNWISSMQLVATKPEDYLRPNTYLAEVDDSPFLEDPLRNAKKRKAQALVVGFRQQGDKGD